MLFLDTVDMLTCYVLQFSPFPLVSYIVFCHVTTPEEYALSQRIHFSQLLEMFLLEFQSFSLLQDDVI